MPGEDLGGSGLRIFLSFLFQKSGTRIHTSDGNIVEKDKVPLLDSRCFGVVGLFGASEISGFRSSPAFQSWGLKPFGLLSASPKIAGYQCENHSHGGAFLVMTK